MNNLEMSIIELNNSIDDLRKKRDDIQGKRIEVRSRKDGAYEKERRIKLQHIDGKCSK